MSESYETMVLAKGLAHAMTSKMRGFLLQHYEGGVMPFEPSDSARRPSIVALVRRGFLAFDRPGFPRSSRLTSKGRPVALAVLEMEADALSANVEMQH